MKRVNLFLWINEWCNLDCSYCNVVKSQKQLTFEDCKKAFVYYIKFFPDAEGYNVFFMWGEPMLSYSDIQKNILYLRALWERIGKPIDTFMPTNGTLLSESRLDFFRKYNHQVSLSIDSLDPSYDYRNIRDREDISSVPVLLKNLKLFQNYSDILRVKIVVMPDMVEGVLHTFNTLRELWFSFINIQPAHWVLWTQERQKAYIGVLLQTKFIASGIENLKSTTLKWSHRNEDDGPRFIWCAKWRSEIFIDSYGEIYVCDAFLAYPYEKRKKYAHDNLFKPNFNQKKFEEYRDWKYCNNTILWDDSDITHCEICDETKSCSTLCNALPNNDSDYDRDILMSNFHLYRKLDMLWI